MDLFNSETIQNILPCDGTVLYFGKIMNREKASTYFETLLNSIEWKNDEAMIFGKLIVTKRKVAWYGDSGFSYTYSGVTKTSIEWTKELLELKKVVEEKTEASYNSCLINLYHSGEEGVGWHSDDEKMLHPTIASLSFGAERKFSFKHKKNNLTTSILLENGGLLLMKDDTQINWLHSITKTKKIIGPRISLTFRTIVHS